MCSLLALTLAVTLTAPKSAAADIGNAAGPDTATTLEGGMLGGGGIIGGDESENVEGDTNESPDAMKPSGDLTQVMRGAAIFDIYVPELPYTLCTSDDGTQPPLRSLLVERADAERPDEWTRGVVIPWTGNSYEDGNERFPSYLLNIGDEFAGVHYTEPNTDFRDLYVRITAYILVNGEVETITYDPVLLRFPDNMKPSKPADEEEDAGSEDGEAGGSDEAAKNEDDETGNFGSIDGNRGGVGQGESERVDPESTVSPLPSQPDVAYASEGFKASGEAAAQTDANSALDDKENVESASASTDATATAKPEASRDGETLASADTSSEASVSEEQIPGFLWAAGITACAVVGLGLVIALVRRAKR